MSTFADPPVASVVLETPPTDLARTLRPLRHGSRDPAAVIGRDRSWFALHTPRGPATLTIAGTRGSPERTTTVHAVAWGDGAEWAVASVPDLVGLTDDTTGFDPSHHPAVARAAVVHAGVRLTRSNRVLDALVPAILEQEITSTEALGAWRHLVLRHGAPAPRPRPAPELPDALVATAPRLLVPPTAQGWLDVPSWDVKESGITQRRRATIRAAADVAPHLERTLTWGRGGVETTRRLTSLPGVGVWTAALTTQTAHGDPDSPAYGDAHVSRGVCWVLAGELLPAAEADERMATLLAPWAGHRERVVRLLLAAGAAAPRRGPRFAPPRHRAW